MNTERDIELTQERVTYPTCDMKTCCYYCPNTINNIDQAEVIIDTTDNINNLVCSFACEGIPDEMKDTCAYCGTLYFGKSDVCDSCWMTAHESCMDSD
jgi:hypothetical protein